MRMASCLVALGAALVLQAGGVTLPAGAAVPGGSKLSDVVYFRSVLYFAPAYSPPASDPSALSASSCSPASRLNVANLGVSPNDSNAGFSSQNVAPDPALAGAPSTSAAKETASTTVFLPGPLAYWPGVARYVLGPAEMTSASASVAGASVSRDQTGAWVVDYTMTKRGSALWDKVAKENFHKLLGIDFHGKVVSAPIIQPSQSYFTSFDGHGEISGNLTKAEAMTLAKALHHG